MADTSHRVGPLTAIAGSDPALAVGDPAVRHVRLTPRGIAPYLADAPSGFVPWAEIDELQLRVPTTWFPSPALADSIGPLLNGLLTGFLVGAAEHPTETPTFDVHITTTDGGLLEWPVTPHYIAGYRRADAATATRLSEHLVTHPEARILLAQPVALLERLDAIAPKSVR